MKTIVLDPGHGGKDPGAVGPTGLRESDVVLAIARHSADLLDNAGVRVLLTRDDDTFLQLSSRARFANREKADLFISLHCNSATNPAEGTETFIARKSKVSYPLAEDIQEHLIEILGTTDRGVKRANYTVLTKTKMAAALAEFQFIHTTTGEAQLRSRSFQVKCASALTAGILQHLGMAPIAKVAPSDPPEPRPCSAIQHFKLIETHAKAILDASQAYQK